MFFRILHDFCEIACRSLTDKSPASGMFRSMTYLGIGSPLCHSAFARDNRQPVTIRVITSDASAALLDKSQMPRHMPAKTWPESTIRGRKALGCGEPDRQRQS